MRDQRQRSGNNRQPNTGSGRPAGARPSGARPAGAKPSGARPAYSRPAGSGSAAGKPAGARPAAGRPEAGRPTGARPAFRKSDNRPGRPPVQREPRKYTKPNGIRPEKNIETLSEDAAKMLQEYIDKMIVARGDERIALAKAMAKQGRPAISAVDRLLNSRDAKLRLIAVMVLSSTTHPDAMRGLIHAMEDEDATVRLQASAGLGNHRRTQARQALWEAFPDRNRAVSVTILRSLAKIMTPDMADAISVMDTEHLPPIVRKEIERIAATRATAPVKTAKPAAEQTIPLLSAPWLRKLIGSQGAAAVVPGMEDVAATLIHWQVPEAVVTAKNPGEILFTVPNTQFPQLVRARYLESVWVALERTAGVNLIDDRAVTATLEAFSQAKGVQSILAVGGAGTAATRALGNVLGLRSSRPPGNPRTLRVRILPDQVWVEYLAETDYPILRQMSGQARALAASLCALAVNSPAEHFLDPFCSDGMVIIERGLLGPVSRLHGYDMDEATLPTAKQNWRRMAPTGGLAVNQADIALWSGMKLPLAASSIDAVASILHPRRMASLTTAHFREIARVLKPGMKAVFLAPIPQVLRDLLVGSGLQVTQEMAAGTPAVGNLIVTMREA